MMFIGGTGSGDTSEGAGTADASRQGTETPAVVHNASMEYNMFVCLM